MNALYPDNPRLLSLLAVGLAIGEVVLDFMTPNTLNVSIIFSIPLVLAGLARQRKLLWSLLFALLCMTFWFMPRRTDSTIFQCERRRSGTVCSRRSRWR